MTQYVLVADGWTRGLEWTDTYPAQMKKWQEYGKGDVIDLDPDNPVDAEDIRRLAEVEFRPALVEKSLFDARSQAQERAAAALAAARAATLTGPTATDPLTASTEGFPEGGRADAPASAVGAGGTDPEPQGLVGEAAGDDYDDTDAWSYGDLQVAARERGLSAGGARVDLVNRLREFDRLNQDPLTVAAANEDLDDDNEKVALRNDQTNV